MVCFDGRHEFRMSHVNQKVGTILFCNEWKVLECIQQTLTTENRVVVGSNPTFSLWEISSSGRATKRYPVVYGSVAESGLLHLSWKQTIRNGPWVRISPLPPNCRELDEWFKSLPWKGSLSVTATWVRIPHSLPVLCSCSLMVKLRAYTSAMPLDEGMIQVRILSGVPRPLWTNW